MIFVPAPHPKKKVRKSLSLSSFGHVLLSQAESISKHPNTQRSRPETPNHLEPFETVRGKVNTTPFQELVAPNPVALKSKCHVNNDKMFSRTVHDKMFLHFLLRVFFCNE